MNIWKRFLFLATLLLVWVWLDSMNSRQSLALLIPSLLLLYVVYVALFGKPGKPQDDDDYDDEFN